MNTHSDNNYIYISINGNIVPTNYFERLPITLKHINIICKKINYIPNLFHFRNLIGLTLSGCKMKTLPLLPNSLERLIIMNMDLEYLPSLENTNLTIILASSNKIKILPSFPNTLCHIDFNYNKITEISNLPHSITHLMIISNDIEKITYFPENVIFINISYNYLTELPLIPENVEELFCLHNKLIMMSQIKSSRINYLAFNSEVNGFINTDYTERINRSVKNINIINKFKSTYYHLLCKKRLRQILWENIREPKIKNMYHPDKLYKIIKNVSDDELEEALNEWCE